jgi:hypothetical protein
MTSRELRKRGSELAAEGAEYAEHAKGRKAGVRGMEITIFGVI